MSKIQTNTLQHTATGAATFTLPTTDGSSGQSIITNGSGQLSFDTVNPYEFSCWRLNSTFQNQDATRDTIENWSESNAANYERLGTLPSYSSGFFTFPSTGYWRVQASLIYYLSSADGDTFGLALDSSTDSGQNFAPFATTGGRLDGNLPANVKLCWVMMGSIKVTNASTFRMRVATVGTKATTGHFMGGSQASGSGGETSTMMIEKIRNL